MPGKQTPQPSYRDPQNTWREAEISLGQIQEGYQHKELLKVTPACTG